MTQSHRSPALSPERAEEVSQRVRAMPLQLVLDEWGTDHGHIHDELAYAATIVAAANEALALRVLIARKEGSTWEQIGSAVGRSTQNVQQVYGDRQSPERMAGNGDDVMATYLAKGWTIDAGGRWREPTVSS